MTVISVINTISSVASLMLFIYLCVIVRNNISVKSEKGTEGDETKQFISTSKILIKEKSFKNKVFVLIGLIVVNIITVLLF